MVESEIWGLTVVRSQGLRLMRPEKSWRPIVTIEVDKHHSHETVLGTDGQNPNLKEVFYLHHASVNSRVEIAVWHRSQSKKKAKKRNLVASASHSLGELLKKQEQDTRAKAEIRLQCHSPTKRSISSRGKPQNGALVLLRVRPPLSIQRSIVDLSESGYSSDSGSSTTGSNTMAVPPSPVDDSWNDDDVLLTKQKLRKRVRGYIIDSDEELHSSDDCDVETPFVDNNSYDEESFGDDQCFDDPAAIRPHPYGLVRAMERPIGWLAASLLPQHTEKVETPPQMSWVERVLASFTLYSELKAATLDSHYDRVFCRLQLEWTYIGGLLVALAAVNTAVFSISPDSIFTVDSYARSAIAASSIASGLGIACDAWFLLRYNWADLHTLMNRARDLYGSYFFFCLSARVPAICMFISAISLMGFLGLVAFEAWPMGVMVTCFMIGLIMTLQFLVYGAHWFVWVVAEGGRAGRRGLTKVFSRTAAVAGE